MSSTYRGEKKRKDHALPSSRRRKRNTIQIENDPSRSILLLVTCRPMIKSHFPSIDSFYIEATICDVNTYSLV